jgi:hypothetical protein
MAPSYADDTSHFVERAIKPRLCGHPQFESQGLGQFLYRTNVRDA